MKIQVPRLNQVYTLQYDLVFETDWIGQLPRELIVRAYPNYNWSNKITWQDIRTFRDSISGPYRFTIPAGSKFIIKSFALTKKVNRVSLSFYKRLGNSFSLNRYFTFDELEGVDFY